MPCFRPRSGRDNGRPLPHLRALTAPGVLAPAGGDIGLIRIHESSVLLAGDPVYKLTTPRGFGVLDSIAFLTVDLEGCRRTDLAGEILAAFVAASGDRTPPAVLPCYQFYQAFVRGHAEHHQQDVRRGRPVRSAPARQIVAAGTSS